ncbi:GtrA family protein [Rhizobium lentis]|uniref:GtrA family protein n=1 Tax=Rhizobium lentis TaxID=1138194 RepID=A0ABS7IJL3_9HYPH|nr:GtrA family protein [Rhizobium lentis]MBX4955268.1 GtrA family protein [Rhizobium lentis]MBX4972811.1 GtrA family protein [Rhizobium lentis]MBX4987051.1 GtrA family protein [Rhizobium lentis]MBX4998440.1 GtrA family protein [Rhizobium lentis]MBX5005495.1 GtrA family protein [Rhizobium lentis]
MKKLIRFAIAGGIGFIVDAGALSALLALTPLGPFLARIIAIALAMAATWAFNRNFTFDRSGRSLTAEGFRYGSVGVTAALVNYGLYSALLLSLPALQPLAALVLASIAAMVFSFFGYSRFVFRPE